jgi:hypothetical protein
MLSTSEKKKIRFAKALLPSYSADLKQYDEIYQVYCRSGYTRELCDMYADAFVNDHKKPAVDDVLQTASLYGKIYDYKTEEFYLDTLTDKKLSSEERYYYCLEELSTISKIGRWRDAEDFRTDNISFIQTYMQKKKTINQQTGMYIALALADCAAKKYDKAFRLLNFGYKPVGKNDKCLLDIMTTAVYINAMSGDKENLDAAINNAKSCLRLFDSFEFEWSKTYFEKRIENAAKGII